MPNTKETYSIAAEARDRTKLRKSEEMMREVIKTRFGSSIRIIGDYNGLKNPWHLYCTTHKVHFYRHGGFLRKGAGCEKCCEERMRNKVRTNAVRKGAIRYPEHLKARHGTKYTLLEPFITLRTTRQFSCKLHGEYSCKPEIVLRKHGGCPECGTLGRRNQSRCITHKHFIQLIAEKTPSIKVLGKYVNKTTRIEFQCRIDGYTWMTTPDSILAGHGCKHCDVLKPRLRGRPIAKEYRLGRKTVTVQGYEPQALDLLLTRYKAKQIVVGKAVPRFEYKIGDKTRRYFPDIFIPSETRIVEVKSLFTFLSSDLTLHNIKRKRKAVLAAGYRFNLMVMTKCGKRIKLPKDWHEMNEIQLRKILL